MGNPYLLHLFTPTPQASPFDVNMAYDAGCTAVIPYCNVNLSDICNLTQDAIFSRGPKGVKRTGIFIGGRDIGAATDMLDAARAAMVPPFVVSVFADPSGAFTTAAAMVAAVERQLKIRHQRNFAQTEVLVLGGTGPVGAIAAVLAAGAGAKVLIASQRGIDAARVTTDSINRRYGVDVQPTDGRSIASATASAHVILATAKAGVQVLSAAELAMASSLLVAADVNAVPPAGIENVGVMDDGVALAAASGKAVGIGALAVGNIKYQCQRRLLVSMLQADKPVFLDFRNAFETAREISA